MNDFLKMDVFFVITTIAVIVLVVLIGVALFYVIRILRDVEHVSSRVAEESDNIRGDLSVLRENIKDEGAKIKHFANFFGTIVERNRPKKKRTQNSSSHD